MRLSQVVFDDIKFNYRTDDKFIGQRIALDKYEKYETAMILSQVNKNSVVIDVGANIGYYTLLLAKICKKVFAFEPDKENFEILKKNVLENNLKNVILINMAVGDKKDKGYMIKDNDNYGNHRLSSQLSDLSSQEMQKVEIVRLDDWWEKARQQLRSLGGQGKIDLIKIDVQGYEQKVIEGAKKILQNNPILFVESEKEIKLDGYKTWSINDFAETSWPIWKGFQIKNNHGYADLWMKNKFTFSDYWTMLKNVNYKKWIKGIMT